MSGIMSICPICQQQRKSGTYTFVSDLCDECYVKTKYYTPDIIYPEAKRSKIMIFELDKVPFVDMDISEIYFQYEDKFYDEIKKEGKEQGKIMATIFNEFDRTEKVYELLINGKVEIEATYFFTNNISDTKANFEDRKKEMLAFYTEDFNNDNFRLNT